jgi:hypothetical protein
MPRRGGGGCGQHDDLKTAGYGGVLRGIFPFPFPKKIFSRAWGRNIPRYTPPYPASLAGGLDRGRQMRTVTALDSLLQAASRLCEQPGQPAPEPPFAPPEAPDPAPAPPEPAGLADLPPAVREPVQPFLRRFTVTRVAMVPPRGAGAVPGATRQCRTESHRRRPPRRELPEALTQQALALGWPVECLRELARLLRPGDRLGEITAKAIQIIRRGGIIQHYYHPTEPQPWRLRVGREQTEATNDA